MDMLNGPDFICDMLCKGKWHIVINHGGCHFDFNSPYLHFKRGAMVSIEGREGKKLCNLQLDSQP